MRGWRTLQRRSRSEGCLIVDRTFERICDSAALPKRIKFSAFLVMSLVLAVLVLGLLYSARRAESSPVSRGEALAVSAGCYACHAASEVEPRVNFRVSSSGAYRSRGLPTFWEDGIESAEIVKEWIRDGSPADERERQQSYLIQMPAYGGDHLSEDEIESLTAWILAKDLSLSGGMGTIELDLPDTLDPEALTDDQLLVFGDRISRQYACYQCHGELGQGGVPNPASFKGYIPGFFGDDFLELTDGGAREEILYWIDHGRGKAIESGWKGRFAKYFFERQATGMPGYESLLSESEKEVLVDFMLLLNAMGPLGTEEIERLSQLITKQVFSENESLAP